MGNWPRLSWGVVSQSGMMGSLGASHFARRVAGWLRSAQARARSSRSQVDFARRDVGWLGSARRYEGSLARRGLGSLGAATMGSFGAARLGSLGGPAQVSIGDLGPLRIRTHQYPENPHGAHAQKLPRSARTALRPHDDDRRARTPRLGSSSAIRSRRGTPAARAADLTDGPDCQRSGGPDHSILIIVDWRLGGLGKGRAGGGLPPPEAGDDDCKTWAAPGRRRLVPGPGPGPGPGRLVEHLEQGAGSEPRPARISRMRLWVLGGHQPPDHPSL